MSPNSQLIEARASIRSQVIGQEKLVDLSIATFLGGGHLLLEGPPGTGKTTLAKALSHAFGLDLARIQMTSDLLPSDIIGVLRLKPGQSEFEFRPGPIFSNAVLADELNRSSPKTQSALLEAMAEGTVSMDGKTHPLPNPFFVIATQNPFEHQGVFLLAESQLDRFTALIEVGLPDPKHELEIFSRKTTSDPHESFFRREECRLLRVQVAELHCSPEVLDYLSRLIQATRTASDILYGASVRAGLQLLSMARGMAYLQGRDHVLPGDLLELSPYVFGHRLSFAGDPRTTLERQKWVRERLGQVRAPA